MNDARPLTQYFVAASADGFIATEDDDLDWLLSLDEDPTADHGNAPNPYAEFIGQVGAIAMGSATYEWVLAHDRGPWPYTQPTWVFTHRDLEIREGGGPITFTHAPVPQVHEEMLAVAGGRNVWLVGGGELVGQFMDHDLLDELHLSIAPVLLGSGKPLLPRRRTAPMRLRSSSTFGDGVFAHLLYSLR